MDLLDYLQVNNKNMCQRGKVVIVLTLGKIKSFVQDCSFNFYVNLALFFHPGIHCLVMHKNFVQEISKIAFKRRS